MKILIFTDTWVPQMNGVVRSLVQTKAVLESWGHTVRVVGPQEFFNFAYPMYPEHLITFPRHKTIRRMIEEFQPDAIHIATEIFVGHAARRACLKLGLRFTTHYHTRLPDYAWAYARLPRWASHWVLHRFHSRAESVLVSTETMKKELEEMGLDNVNICSLGVDTKRFRPTGERIYPEHEKVFLYVGRIAIEKNVEEFLKLDLPGRKVAVGTGPMLETYRERYPSVEFVGHKEGEELTRYFNSADVFVFASVTDTFGLVMLEAMACGTPVAAFPVQGPKDVVATPRVGVLHENLGEAAVAALSLSRRACREYAERFTWQASALTFLEKLAPLNPSAGSLAGSLADSLPVANSFNHIHARSVERGH